MAFSHIRDDVSSKQASKQEDSFHCRPHMVGLAKAHSNNSLALSDRFFTFFFATKKNGKKRSGLGRLSYGKYTPPTAGTVSDSVAFCLSSLISESKISGNVTQTFDHKQM